MADLQPNELKDFQVPGSALKMLEKPQPSKKKEPEPDPLAERSRAGRVDPEAWRRCKPGGRKAQGNGKEEGAIADRGGHGAGRRGAHGGG